MAVGSVANSETFKTTTPSDREIVVTKLFNAPRRLVFEAMTTPEHVVRALYPSPEVRDSVLKTGMEKGAGISYDRLEDVVRELQSDAS
jgi:uncharacterized protein YndB with AHSA1/START domain